MHAKAGIATGARLTAATDRRCTTIASTSATILRVHLISHAEDGAPNEYTHAAFG